MGLYHSPRIVTNGLVLALDAADRNSYVSGSTTWYDLAGSKNGTLTNGPTFDSANNGSIVFDNSDDYVSFLNFNVTTSLTFNTFVNISSYTGNNPGFWRSDTTLNGCNGNEFIIFQLNTGLPWIRWNGSDILKPISGYSVPLSTWIYLTYVIENGGPGVSFYANGDLKHSSTHSSTINTFPINFFGCQCQLSEKVAGKYAHISYYNRALSATEIQQNFNALRGRFGI
jgi:hypothetical protein